MGAWGVRAFDNDNANDWAYDLDDAEDLSLIEEAFETVEESSDYLESPDACNALAACEVLARLKGNTAYQDAFTETVDAWVKAHPLKVSAKLIKRANAVIDRILADESELKELWIDSDENEGWLAAVEELRGRVKG